jgi:hypothetical protein
VVLRESLHASGRHRVAASEVKGRERRAGLLSARTRLVMQVDAAVYTAALSGDREQMVAERMAFFEREVPLLAGLPPPLLRCIAATAVRAFALPLT